MKKFGSLFTIKDGQETKNIWTGYGKPEPDEEYRHPLVTIEKDKNGEVWESIRYFADL